MIIGGDWLIDQVNNLTDEITHIKPSTFNEQNRYLPESVTSMPGYIRYDVNPFMREIIDCFDINSPVREVNLMKGVQITYSTLLESGALYFMKEVKTVPLMYMTADKELAGARVENNFIPMINHSGFADIIRSSDEGNARKSGKTRDHIQWEGGGYMVPFGANNANKMRSFSIMVMLKDEIDAWPETVGQDGDPDSLSDDRCAAYWERRKIFRGSTPLIWDTSKIRKQYERGDQRKYYVLCKHCNFPQYLRWSGRNQRTGQDFGFVWETEKGRLVNESVRYKCEQCGTEHYEHDKVNLFSEEHGAHWKPTAIPVDKDIRSYHIPALYSPIGMQPWYKSVAAYLEGYDPISKRVKDIGKYQVFYNNVLGEPFKMLGTKLTTSMVNAHKRAEYSRGNIPQEYSKKVTGSPILNITMAVDVHQKSLDLSIIGWTRGCRSFLLDYELIEAPEGEPDYDCTDVNSRAWPRLRDIIENRKYDNMGISITLIDSGFGNDTVCSFCSQYTTGVYPILGRDRPAKSQTIREFGEFETQIGTKGYRIIVDHYKDRLAPTLRREWDDIQGLQPDYHFNAPVDMLDKEMKELTTESRRKKTDQYGRVSYYWHRPDRVRNELWDLLVYNSAAIEIMAYNFCINYLEAETVSWDLWWDYLEFGSDYIKKRHKERPYI